MQRLFLHDWPVTKQEAYDIQHDLAPKIIQHSNLNEPAVIAAVDTAYGFGGEKVYASAVLMSFPELEPLGRAAHWIEVDFPYIPGMFYFREGEVMIMALAKLEMEADLIIVHGHGTAHPRGCGIAGMIGLEFDRPSIGCARRLLIGTHRPVEEERGNSQPIQLRGREVGVALRTKDGVKPLFVSPGHLCDQEHSTDIIKRCLRGYRLPEPLRMAHALANRFKRMREQDRKKRPQRD
ncbi:MAG: endonuclease V [candidate division Zixibacteria bacterium]